MSGMETRVLGAALATIMAVALVACDQHPAAQTPKGPVEVGTIIVQPQTLAITTELPGRTSAFRVAEVRPQVNGIITKRLFREGSDVRSGQQLYQIDAAPYQAALDSAKADLAKAEANVKSVKAKADRYTDLVKINAISKQDYDDAMATLEQDQAQIASAKAEVNTAQINLEYTKVYAPINGRIGKSMVTEGALVTSNQASALSTIQQLDPIYVDVTQSSAELLRLRRDIAAGHLQGADADKAPVTLTIEGDGQPYNQTGELQFSDVTVDQTSGAVTLRALFANPKQELLPGLFVRAKVDQGSKSNAIVITQKAVVRTTDGNAIVWIVGADNKVQPRPVKTDRAVGDAWLIVDGLHAGDQVVVEGVQKIRPGVDVKAVALPCTNVAAVP